MPFNVHLFTFSSHSLSVPLTQEIRSDFATPSCHLSPTDRDLSLCQHPAASYKLSHSRWQGLLTCPSITAETLSGITGCLYVYQQLQGRCWDWNQLCATQARHSVSWQEFDREPTTASELNLFNMSAGHTIRCNFTCALLRLYSAS